MAIRRRHPGHDRPRRTHTHAAQWLHDERFWIIVAIGILILLMVIVVLAGTQTGGTQPTMFNPYFPY